MWQPDGWGQTRIGVLTPHADVVPESEFSALAPAGISIHATRFFSVHIDRAAPWTRPSQMILCALLPIRR